MNNLFPTINATLNSLSGILLCLGFYFIKIKNWRAHGYTMVSATVVSAIFLGCYLTYHYMYGERSTRAHPGLLRDVYLLLLFPHLLLAIAMLPMIYLTLFRAYNRQWVSHRKIAFPTFLIWLYVSITGVIVYFMLYHTSLAT
jgi:uncharacterized membrane protein YozB (DUF420 family)